MEEKNYWSVKPFLFFFGIKMWCMDKSCCSVHFLAVPGHCIIQVWIFSKPLHFRQEQLYSLQHRGWQQIAVSCYKQLCRRQRVVKGGVWGKGGGYVRARTREGPGIELAIWNQERSVKEAAAKHPQRTQQARAHRLYHWLTVWHIEPWLEWQVGGDWSPFNEYFNKLAYWASSYLLSYFAYLFSDPPLLFIPLYPLSWCPCSLRACHMLKVHFGCALCVLAGAGTKQRFIRHSGCRSLHFPCKQASLVFPPKK